MKKKTYVLMLSKNFPAYHPKAGQPTNFFQAIQNQVKIHTIRSNYDLWAKRASEINAGKAVLSIREWTGKPYKSKQKELMQMEWVNVQKLERTVLGWFIDDKDSDLSIHDLSRNDGLIFEDFSLWFKLGVSGFPIDKPFAIIHFSRFRYL